MMLGRAATPCKIRGEGDKTAARIASDIAEIRVRSQASNWNEAIALPYQEKLSRMAMGEIGTQM
jgi:hypothetical protein